MRYTRVVCVVHESYALYTSRMRCTRVVCVVHESYALYTSRMRYTRVVCVIHESYALYTSRMRCTRVVRLVHGSSTSSASSEHHRPCGIAEIRYAEVKLPVNRDDGTSMSLQLPSGPVPPKSNYQRQVEFRKRNPGYYGRLHRKRKAEAEAYRAAQLARAATAALPASRQLLLPAASCEQLTFLDFLQPQLQSQAQREAELVVIDRSTST
jgi:hypothetical protein